LVRVTLEICLSFMTFDIRTLLVAVALANVFCTGARFLLWRMHPGIPGLGRWALAGVAGVLTFILLISFEFSFWRPLLPLAQLVVLFGLLLNLDGFRCFVGRRPLSPVMIAALTSIVLVWIIATSHLPHPPEARVLGNAVLIMVLSLLIARELLRAQKPIPPAMRATGFIFAINALVFLMRIVLVDHVHHGQAIDPVNPSGITAFMLLWWLCITIAVTLGMILMTSERLQTYLDGQANRDPLTGALNRRSFTMFTEKAMAQSRRHNQPLSMLVMDLDDFKKINDRLGHDVGDMLLCLFVNVADDVLRNDDIFCRYGGEEFVALLPNTSAEQALVTAKRLCNTFTAGSTAEKTSNEIQPVTVSIGIADLGQDEDFESFFRRADTALYKAKDMGRNRCQLAENIAIKLKSDASVAL
jgi:diguanylate cyclase (GGDEF)-like protein